MPIKHALLSVSDKSGIVEFARRLHAAGVKLTSTSRTATMIRDAGLPVRDISDLTGYPEILDGRVKTLHPAVHGGILARRADESHQETLEELDIEPIDLVVVNLYPFEKAAANPSNTIGAVIEEIDIGGPTLLRAAAKNHRDVTVVCDPADYATVADDIERAGDTTIERRIWLAAKVFTSTARYDAAISDWIGSKAAARDPASGGWPATLALAWPLKAPLRYGENPHQGGAVYGDPSCTETSILSARQLQGKELSYNNLLDGDAALEMVRDFADLSECAVVIVKHGNPCGIAAAASPIDAFTDARATDPDSAFGGVIACSSEVDEEVAAAISEAFCELVIAPSFAPDAVKLLAAKKNLRLLETGPFTARQPRRALRGITGGMLACDRDLGEVSARDLNFVTSVKPAEELVEDMLFAWRCAKWVKSNAIVFAQGTATLAIGAGQMSRLDALKLAATKARQPLAGSVMASDAFFPFRDCVDLAAQHGVRAIIQPGGSIRDQESIDAADHYGIAMAFTGMRHFRH